MGMEVMAVAEVSEVEVVMNDDRWPKVVRVTAVLVIGAMVLEEMVDSDNN